MGIQAGISIRLMDGKKYEDFFIKEFIPAIENSYRIRAVKRYRGIAGLSMGGYGSMIYGLKYPEWFAAVAALSAAIFTDDEMINIADKKFNTEFGSLYGNGLKGNDRLNTAWYANSILKLVET